MKKLLISLLFLILAGFAFAQEKYSKAKAYESEGNYVYALAEYYKCYEQDQDSQTREIMDSLAEKIKAGKFGKEMDDSANVYELWLNNMEYFEKYVTENCIYNINLSNIKKIGAGTRANTDKYSVKVSVEYTAIGKFIIDAFSEGYKNEYAWNWETPMDWPFDGIAALRASNLIYKTSFKLVDGKSKVLYYSGTVIADSKFTFTMDNCSRKIEEAINKEDLYIVPIEVVLEYNSSDYKYDISTVMFNGVTGKDYTKRPLRKSEKVRIWSFNDEVPSFVIKGFSDKSDAELEDVIITSADSYMDKVLSGLEENNENAPDIFVVEDEYLAKFTKGSFAKYVMPYKDLGIDVEKEVAAAEIPEYVLENCSNSNGDLVSLGYQSTCGVFIYRRSLAKKAFGTDNPKGVREKIGGLSGAWEDFYKAAELCGDRGIAIVSGYEDLWKPFFYDSDKGWVVDGKLYIDPSRELFMDYAKLLSENGYTNKGALWSENWFKAMKGTSSKPVLGFFAPTWFINYVLAYNCDGTYGDWAVCNAPVGFTWGGSWIFVNKNISQKKLNAVREVVKWICLDSSNDGLQYKWANAVYCPSKDSVYSGVVMKEIKAPIAFMNNQNIFKYALRAEKQIKGNNITVYDTTINSIWLEEVDAYVKGLKTKEQAIGEFKLRVKEALGL